MQEIYAMTDTMVSRYLECSHWPVLRDSEGRERSAGDNYGDIECPFCDFVVCNDGATLTVGDQCKRCKATVAYLKPTRTNA